MNIGGIAKLSTIDFPGRIACVIFTRGCDLDCFYCHNRELIAFGEARVTESEAFAFLEKRRGLLEGVVVSGGEPTLQPDLADFLTRVRAMGYETKLDTNGQHPERLRALLDARLLDYVALDVKAPAEDCARVTGNARALANATASAVLLADAHIDYELRTTMYPGLTAARLAALLSRLPAAPRYRLNEFRMPELARESDLPALNAPALRLADLKPVEAELRLAQPGLLFS